jgi:hypothetical protein
VFSEVRTLKSFENWLQRWDSALLSPVFDAT